MFFFYRLRNLNLEYMQRKSALESEDELRPAAGNKPVGGGAVRKKQGGRSEEETASSVSSSSALQDVSWTVKALECNKCAIKANQKIELFVCVFTDGW